MNIFEIRHIQKVYAYKLNHLPDGSLNISPPAILHGVVQVKKEVQFHLYLLVKFDKSDRIMKFINL